MTDKPDLTALPIDVFEDIKASGVVEEPREPYPIFGADEDGVKTDSLLAWAIPADEAVARAILAQPVGDDGRSGLMWFRLQNGDLILGVFPRGDSYFATEADPKRDVTPALEQAAIVANMAKD